MQQAIGKYRWTICGLIFFATTINYIDRSVISFLKSTFTNELHWNDADYTNVEITFKIFYAVGMIGAGRIIDKLGTKIGYSLFTFLWSLAGVCTAFVNSVLGFHWLIFWIILYQVPQKQKKLSAEEFAYIQSDKDESVETTEQPKLSWVRLLGFKQTWAFVIGKFLTDPIWWFYIFWLPDFFESVYKIKLEAASWPVATVYIISTVGSIWGGWVPLNLIRNGKPVFKARKTSMLIYAFLVLP